MGSGFHKIKVVQNDHCPRKRGHGTISARPTLLLGTVIEVQKCLSNHFKIPKYILKCVLVMFGKNTEKHGHIEFFVKIT